MDPLYHSMAVDLVEPNAAPFIIPVASLVIGGIMMAIPKVAIPGKLVLYFGAQSFMNIFMGWLFRTRILVPSGFKLPSGDVLEEDLQGCPVGFALTVLQQVISGVCFIVLYGCLYFTPYKIAIRPISTAKELLSICLFGCAFALNVALNNVSLGYISIAVNLIIRSCLPLTTFLSQQCLSAFGLCPAAPCKPLKVGLMVVGVLCAGLFVVAKTLGSASRDQASGSALGALACLASLLCGSLNLALAGVLGTMQFRAHEAVAYMSGPSALFLLPLALFLEKPLPRRWGEVFGVGHASDWQILQKVCVIAPATFALFALSGVFSFAYNVLQFTVVQTLSPSASAFGGNFNKAALVFMTLVLPFLRVHDLPGPPYIVVIWLAVLGNIAAFGFYSYLEILEMEEMQQKDLQRAEAKKALTSEYRQKQGQKEVQKEERKTEDLEQQGEAKEVESKSGRTPTRGQKGKGKWWHYFKVPAQA